MFGQILLRTANKSTLSGVVNIQSRVVSRDRKWKSVYSNYDDHISYTIDISKREPFYGESFCFAYGTQSIEQDYGTDEVTCVCKAEWEGARCSIPSVVASSESFALLSSTLTLRQQPRRLIDSFVFSLEWEMLEARVASLYNLVDVFLVLESNSTLSGQAQPRRLLQRLRDGYLGQYQAKILYVAHDLLPHQGLDNAESLQLNFLSTYGLQQVLGLRDDDIFLLSHADELLVPEVLVFLRHHDHYPEQIGFSLRHSRFGFYWRDALPQRPTLACSIAFLRDVLRYEAADLRSGRFIAHEHPVLRSVYDERVKAFVTNGGRFGPWVIGSRDNHAGWHCSWCLSIEGIAEKMKITFHGDYARWGDDSADANVTHIRDLVRYGLWIDDRDGSAVLENAMTDDFYAPPYFVQNWEKYEHLLNVETV